MPRIHTGRAVATLGMLALTPCLLGAVDHRSNFEERLLASHNRERVELGLAPLSWNSELAAGAKQWSDHLARTGRFEHSPDIPGEPEGENIWGGTPDSYPPERMVGRWIAEKAHFQKGTFPANSRTGNVADVSHYTQVIWRDSREVGCALSRGRQEEILVCRYLAPGNVVGRSPV